MKTLTVALFFAFLVLLSSGEGLWAQRWETEEELSLDPSLMPYAPYNFTEYDNFIGSRHYDVADDPITQVQVAPLPDAVLESGEQPYRWNADPSMSHYGAYLNPDGSADFVWNRLGIYAVRLTRSVADPYIEFVLPGAAIVAETNQGVKFLAIASDCYGLIANADLMVAGVPGNQAMDILARKGRALIGTNSDQVVQVATVNQFVETVCAVSVAKNKKLRLIVGAHGIAPTLDPEHAFSGFSFNNIPAGTVGYIPESPGVMDLLVSQLDKLKGKVSFIEFASCGFAGSPRGADLTDLICTRVGIDTVYVPNKTISSRNNDTNKIYVSKESSASFQLYCGSSQRKTLTTEVRPAGSGTITVAGGIARPGMPGLTFNWYDMATVSAKPNRNFKFDHWEVDPAGPEGVRDNPLTPSGTDDTVRISENKKVIAIFTEVPVDLSCIITGSKRFPGDAGIAVVSTTRPNSGTSVTDDNISLTLAIDNSTGVPIGRNLEICADQSVILPAKGLKPITEFFRPVDGGGPIINPITLPTGRTILHLEVSRTSVKTRLANIVKNKVFNLPFRVFLDDPATDTNPCTIEGAVNTDEETVTVGLRKHVGRPDDNTAASYMLVQSPTATGDSINVRFPAVNMPKIFYSITDLQFVGGEFGGTGLPGLDALELRREDPILTGNPDLSPNGMIRSAGIRDGVGSVSAGPPPTTVIADIADITIDPTIMASDLFVLAIPTAGDTINLGTLIATDETSETLLRNSSCVVQGEQPAKPFPEGNFMVGLSVNNFYFSGKAIRREYGVSNGDLPRRVFTDTHR